ncbi:hypothetical protein REPUB_Repub08aG0003100 [Reevesia pubescens]
MWRRVASLSSIISSSKNSSVLAQTACRFNIWESLTTGIAQQVKGVIVPKEKTPFITFVLGGPGSGKGTQCIRIVETFGFTHLSAGDLLRREITSNSADGAMILDTIKEGKIVPSQVTVKLIQKEMELSDNYKFLIDGFPRTEENRKAFEQIIGVEPNVVLFFDCPEEEMVKRVLNRNQGRVDDNLETIRKRLKVFEALSLPVINYYSQRGNLRKINAVGMEDEIFEQVRPVFTALEVALQIHGWVLRRGIEWNLSFVNALIVVYSSHGKLDRFEQMESSDTLPDSITFVAMLSACAHLTLVKDGERLFSLMGKTYAINPIMEHYACMVNLYGKAGLINEAFNFIVERMEMWGALLYACSVHGNINIGEIAAQNLFELEPDNEQNFKLLMKNYRNAGKLEDVERVRTMMLDRGL